MAESLYSVLAERYGEIFPVSADYLAWAVDFAGHQALNVLDIGCGTGELDFLAAERLETAVITGIDNSKAMIAQAKKKYRCGNLSFRLMDMNRLKFPVGTRFDRVLCAGNTWCHLDGRENSRRVLSRIGGYCASGCKIRILVLNYELILRDKPERLAAIETADWKFSRLYFYENAKIRFKIELERKKDRRMFTSQTLLYPFRAEELREDLESCGFAGIVVSGDLKGGVFKAAESPLAVVDAVKK